MSRWKYSNFFTSKFRSKILLSNAPIPNNGVQSEVGFFLKNPWGPKSYAELLTWAPNNFYCINCLLFLTWDHVLCCYCQMGPFRGFKKMFYFQYVEILKNKIRLCKHTVQEVFFIQNNPDLSPKIILTWAPFFGNLKT